VTALSDLSLSVCRQADRPVRQRGMYREKVRGGGEENGGILGLAEKKVAYLKGGHWAMQPLCFMMTQNFSIYSLNNREFG